MTSLKKILFSPGKFFVCIICILGDTISPYKKTKRGRPQKIPYAQECVLCPLMPLRGSSKEGSGDYKSHDAFPSDVSTFPSYLLHHLFFI